jgi:hypothetical protein
VVTSGNRVRSIIPLSHFASMAAEMVWTMAN